MSARDEGIVPGNPAWRPDFHTLQDLALGILEVELMMGGGSTLMSELRVRYGQWNEATNKRLPTLEMFFTRFDKAVKKLNNPRARWSADEANEIKDAFAQIIGGAYTDEERKYIEEFIWLMGEGDNDDKS